MKNTKVICFVCISIFLTSCVSPNITKESASKLPPYPLCKEYKKWSDVYAGNTADVDKEKTAEKLRMMYEVIKEREIDCNKELLIDIENTKSNKKSIVNCVPNQFTGGITCF